MPKKSKRLNNLPAYIFSVIGDNIRKMNAAGIDVYRLDIGNPDMPPADHVVEALARSARQPGHHGYTGYRGIASFRQAVARYYALRFGVDVDPDTQVLPLIGSKEGIINLTLAYIDQGDVALVPDIGYPSYAMGTRLAGGTVQWMALTETNGFLPDFDSIPHDVSEKTRLLWVNYPNNPTGAVAGLEFYQKAVDFCRENNILLASDNPYVDVTFDGYKAGSALSAAGALDHTIEFMSLSKSYNMAGWRIGAAVGSAQAIKNLLHVKSNVDSGHFHPIYDAAINALDETSQQWLDERNEIYMRRRNLILNALSDIGLTAEKRPGSLYIWAKPLRGSATQYVERALSDAHVSLAPGEAYGPGGANYIRMSIAVPEQRLTEALDRLKVWYSTSHNIRAD